MIKSLTLHNCVSWPLAFQSKNLCCKIWTLKQGYLTIKLIQNLQKKTIFILGGSPYGYMSHCSLCRTEVLGIFQNVLKWVWKLPASSLFPTSCQPPHQDVAPWSCGCPRTPSREPIRRLFRAGRPLW